MSRPYSGVLMSQFELMSLESYSRFDDAGTKSFPAPFDAGTGAGSGTSAHQTLRCTNSLGH